MKNILLTGATGFLGSWLLKKFVDDGHRVIILKRSFSSSERISNYLSKVQVYDIDRIPVRHVFNEQKINILVHTATNYGRDNNSLMHVLNDNLNFPVELLELALDNRVEAFFNTDTFFNKSGVMKYDYLPNYTLSKRLFVEVLKANYRNIKSINCRLEHIYGPHDHLEKFIPFVAQSLLKNKDKVELTSGKQKRDFIYVEDVADLYSALIANLSLFSEGYHDVEIGTGKSVTVFEMVNLLKSLVRDNHSILDWGSIPQRHGEIEESKADLSGIPFVWSPRFDLRQGLLRTIDFYSEEFIKS